MLIFINIAAWAVLLTLPVFGIRRGSSAILCIGIYVLVFSFLVAAAAPTLAEALPPMVGVKDEVNIGWWQLVLSAPLFALAFPLGLYMNRFMVYSFEPFEEILGMIIGLAVGFVVIRTMLGAINLCASETEFHAAVNQLFLMRQTVALDGFHGMQQWFANLARATELGPPPPQ
jgi:hypothetical protein